MTSPADRPERPPKGAPSPSGGEPRAARRATLGGAVHFLTGADDEPAPQAKAELPGWFSFVRRGWAARDERAPDEGFWTRVRRLHGDYQVAKVRTTENLRIYETIAQSARFSKEFVALLISSCLIATFGLFQGSVATIIGAMLVAPLMMPILGFSLGVLWGDRRLLWRSLATLAIGTVVAVAIAFVLATVVPGVEVNSEIAGRTKPNLYDILVAVVSGMIGAYAYANPLISSSIAGVAIAIALVPPLCVVGIGLALGLPDVALGATLLYLSNMVGISLAASFVFWRVRVHPVTATEREVGARARANVVLTAVLLTVIAVPLGYFMHRTFELKRYHARVSDALRDGLGRARVLSLDVRRGNERYEVDGVVIVPEGTSGRTVRKVKRRLAGLFGEPADVDLVVLRTGDFPDDEVPDGDR